MKDQTCTRRPSSRLTSTPPPTIPQRLESSTTNQTPPLRHAEPTTTVTTAETQPTDISLFPCPRRTLPHCHAGWSNIHWSPFSELGLVSLRTIALLLAPSVLCMVGFVISVPFVELFHQKMSLWSTMWSTALVSHSGGGGGCFFEEPDWIKLCQLAALDWKQVEKAEEDVHFRDCWDCWCRV